jgi:hypothetical protein
MDFSAPALYAGFGTLGTAIVGLVVKVINTDKTLTAHIVADTTLFKSIQDAADVQIKVGDERHEDVKDRLVRIEAKLDRQNGYGHGPHS